MPSDSTHWVANWSWTSRCAFPDRTGAIRHLYLKKMSRGIGGMPYLTKKVKPSYRNSMVLSKVAVPMSYFWGLCIANVISSNAIDHSPSQIYASQTLPTIRRQYMLSQNTFRERLTGEHWKNLCLTHFHVIRSLPCYAFSHQPILATNAVAHLILGPATSNPSSPCMGSSCLSSVPTRA